MQELRLDIESHRSALWWVGLLYRFPLQLAQAEKNLSRTRRLLALAAIYAHCCPYIVVFGVLVRVLVFEALEEQPNAELSRLLSSYGSLGGHAVSLMRALAAGLAFGLVISLSKRLTLALTFGLSIATAAAVGFGAVGGAFFGTAVMIVYRLHGGWRSLAFNMVLGSAGGLVNNFNAGIGTGIGWGIWYFLATLRLYYIPLHLFLLLCHKSPKAYSLHPAGWDGLCFVPFPGLSLLLVSLGERDPDLARREVERLIDTSESQRSQALRAKAILEVRRAGNLDRLDRLDYELSGLPEGRRGFLAEVPEIRMRVRKISAAQARLDAFKRPFLREPYAELVVKEVEGFRNQIAGFKPPLSTELRRAAERWLALAHRQLEEARRASSREPTVQVFRAGDPVYRDQEAFLYRDVLFHELERQMMLAAGCPGLLIYGRRRMGKTTLLNNLPGFMPPQLGIAYLSMDSAAAFSSLESFTQQVAHQSRAAFPSVLAALDVDTPQNLESLETFLARVDERLKRAERRLLLAIDEFENLNVKIGQGVIPVDLLAVVRDSIQRHRQIVWAFAGSHSISELANAPWTSYLVSARTVEIPPFALEETRLLLTEPLKHSTLWRDLDSSRPSFASVFWGPEGIERIQAETGGWPHLVQLVAEAVVDLVNDAGVEAADAALLRRAFDSAVTRGNNVLMELTEKECRLPGEWEYLLGFRTQERQAIPRDEEIGRSLRRRLLVTQDHDQFRLRVPLMGRWLRTRV